MKDIGLVGLPFSGKSTLFTALTRTGGHGGQANHALVPVPDPRVDVLTEMERSRKTVHAQVGFVDVPGGTASAQGIAKLREADALAIVVRCFGPDAKPAFEVAEVRDDLLLADQAVIEPALEKAEKRARGKPTAEVDALAAANEALQAEIALSDAGLSEEHRRELKPIAPLTIKPSIVVANLEEGTEVPEGLPEGTVGVYASIEAETATSVAKQTPNSAAIAILVFIVVLYFYFLLFTSYFLLFFLLSTFHFRATRTRESTPGLRFSLPYDAADFSTPDRPCRRRTVLRW